MIPFADQKKNSEPLIEFVQSLRAEHHCDMKTAT